MTMPSDSSKDDKKKADSEATDEFLNMDPGAFDNVDDLFADPSMIDDDDEDNDSKSSQQDNGGEPS
ncbi:MAG: hypothetical protein R3236_11900 [Phycisphaeraceae bacterium]|nr:hypothetical protein [Phycisphaeraceae bacterium]